MASDKICEHQYNNDEYSKGIPPATLQHAKIGVKLCLIISNEDILSLFQCVGVVMYNLIKANNNNEHDIFKTSHFNAKANKEIT